MTIDAFLAWLRNPDRRPAVMGILNVTPDSFSDGGRYSDAGAACAAAEELIRVGADVIDIGGESTRPGAQRVDAAEQRRRIIPVIDALARSSKAVISVDTTRAEVAEAALDAGAAMINDISAGLEDAAMLPLAARRAAPIALMHMQGEPGTMQYAPAYSDVCVEVREHLQNRLRAAADAGIAQEQIMLDPGIGFGKTIEHNLTLLRRLDEFRAIGRPLLVGTSRKGFIGRITGETGAAGRLMGSAASVAWSIARGADMVRVHDVGAMSKVVRMIRAIQSGADESGAV